MTSRQGPHTLGDLARFIFLQAEEHQITPFRFSAFPLFTDYNSEMSFL